MNFCIAIAILWNSIIPPHLVWIHWTPAIDSDNTVYVLMATTNLINWQTITVTEDTNAYSSCKQQEFYSLYSSNTLTKCSMPAQ